MNKWLIIIIVVLGIILGISLRQGDMIYKKYETAIANIKAYDKVLSESNENSLALQLTIDQLKYFGDSTLKELDKTRKQLKIKDKNLKALQEIMSSFSKRDTIILKDTIFRDPSFKIDTLVGDAWYNIRIGLEYPSMVSVNPKFKSEKHIVVSTKRETINPPKKFFLFRWFQKKHTVLQVDVVEKSPYVQDKESRYIEIIK